MLIVLALIAPALLFKGAGGFIYLIFVIFMLLVMVLDARLQAKREEKIRNRLNKRN